MSSPATSDAKALRPLDRGLLAAAFAFGAAATLRRFGLHGVTPPAGLCLAAAGVCAIVPLARLFGPGAWDGRKRAILAVLFGAHLVATLFFFPPEDLANGRPAITLDYAVHYYEVDRARETFPHTGSLAAYDPFFMAGYPGGTVFEIDTNGVALWCALARFLDPPRAYKLFIAFAYLAAAFTLFAASRRMGLGTEESVAATLLFLVYWHWGKPYAGDFRFAGMFAYLFVCHLSLYLVGLFRSVLRGERAIRFFVYGPLAFLVHPSAVVLLAIPMAALWIAEWRERGGGEGRRSWSRGVIAKLFLWAALILAANAIWLVPFFRYLDIKVPSQTFFQIPGPVGLLRILARPGSLPAVAMAALAILGFARLARRRRLAEGIALGCGSLFLLFVAACGVYLPLFNQMEPGRFLVPAFIFMAPLAGAGLAPLFGEAARALRAPHRAAAARCAGVVTLVCAVPLLGLASSRGSFVHAISTTPTEEMGAMIEALQGAVGRTGRLMVEDGPAWIYGESHFPSMIPLYTGVEQIGGPYAFAFIEHGFTTFQRDRTMGRPLARLDAAAFRRYLDLYNVHWILTATPETRGYVARLDYVRELWASKHFNLWGVGEASEFADRAGVSVSATYDSIRVALSPEAASGPPILLKYHWDRELRARPPARISPVRELDDPVPFIRLDPGGAADVLITFR